MEEIRLENALPVGKLPPELLRKIIMKSPRYDGRLVLGPGVGLDCGVVDMGDRYLILKVDPITFVTDDIGWYAVNIAANDIATTGAKPVWMMISALFPEGATDAALVSRVTDQLAQACAELEITLANAHTEITHNLDRPILTCSLIGEVAKDRLILPTGARPGDEILITKGVPIEGTAILASEFPDRLAGKLTGAEISAAQGYSRNPGIGVTRDARIAAGAGKVTAMHDPTEGGLAAALWELSEAARCAIEIDPAAIPIPDVSRKILAIFGLNPLNTIASGALLMTVDPADGAAVLNALNAAGIPAAKIGRVLDETGTVSVRVDARGTELPRPEVDEIAGVFAADGGLKE